MPDESGFLTQGAHDGDGLFGRFGVGGAGAGEGVGFEVVEVVVFEVVEVGMLGWGGCGFLRRFFDGGF